MKRHLLLALTLVALSSVPVWADDVLLDDLIVNGSACVGTDCAEGENFGFDTIRLKENNLRIHFQDTSTSGAFPTNDWQLVANDSANGGQSHFSIEDVTAANVPFRVLAGAPQFALFAGPTGVGLGTDAPGRPLHVAAGDTPALRLQQTTVAGWPGYVWDVGGNETGFFLRDETAGTAPLRVEPGSPDAALVLASDGRVGLGTDAPAASLHVASEDGVVLRYEDLTSGAVWEERFGPDPDVAGGRAWTLGEVDGVEALRVTHDGNVEIAGTLTQGSSRSIKRGIEAVDPQALLEAVNSLEIARWQYRTDASASAHMGPMAEDFHAQFGLGADGQHIAPGDLAGVAVGAAQALSQRVRQQDAEIRRLRGETHELRERLARIEALLRAR